MEKWRRKASRERDFCGQFAKKTVRPVAAAFHEPKRPIGASNFYRRDCKKQVQTLTVRYAKLSPGLRTPRSAFVLRGCWERPSASFWRGLRLAGFFEERHERVVRFRATRDAAEDFAEFAGKGMTRACDDHAQ
jgi:hypothetical protein